MIELERSYTYIIGLDNGSSCEGIALLGPELVRYEKLPIKKELNYQKEEHYITRVDVPKLRQLFANWKLPKDDTLVVMERAMVNPMRFRASISAVRCLEAELIVIEEFGFELQYLDSKAWQKILLPDIVGSKELKKASLELGKKLFPNLKLKHDADSLLIAYYIKNKAELEKPKQRKIKTL